MLILIYMCVHICVCVCTCMCVCVFAHMSACVYVCSLHFVYHASLVSALELVDKAAVTHVFSPSGRNVYQVLDIELVTVNLEKSSSWCGEFNSHTSLCMHDVCGCVCIHA